jgi:hypothetical protein
MTNITKQTKYLPPPFVDLDCVVKNETTGEIGFKYEKDGKGWYNWCFKDEKAAKKELATL